RGFAPRTPRHALSLQPSPCCRIALRLALRSRGPFAALTRADRGFAPRTPRQSHSLALGGCRPSDSPTRSLASTFAVLPHCAQVGAPFAWLVRCAHSRWAGVAPRTPRQSHSLALGRSLRSPGRVSPPGLPDSLTRSRWGARSVRPSRSRRSLALGGTPRQSHS